MRQLVGESRSPEMVKPRKFDEIQRAIRTAYLEALCKISHFQTCGFIKLCQIYQQLMGHTAIDVLIAETIMSGEAMGHIIGA